MTQPKLTPPEELSVLYYRPPSPVLDLVAVSGFYFFASVCAMDSAWGMLLCAEWGVRSVAVPATLYEQFLSYLHPDPTRAETRRNSMWIFRLIEPRAVHPGLPKFGCFWGTDGIGVVRSPSWDPFYFVDRAVFSLFISTVCLVYINSGMIGCACITYCTCILYVRVRSHATVIVDALFQTLAWAKDNLEEGGGTMSGSERQIIESLSRSVHQRAH